MNTDTRRSNERLNAPGQSRFGPICVYRRSSAARLSLALLFSCVFFALMFSHSAASARAGQTQAQTLTENLKGPQFIADGAKLFALSCGSAYCHGSGGIGGGAPRLRGKDLDAQYLFKTISNGVSGTPMLSFKSDFSEEQIWKLVAFILSDSSVNALPTTSPARPSTDPTPSQAHPEAPSAGTLSGNAQAGKVLFFDSSQPKSCHACHAFNAEGNAVGPDLSNTGSKSAKELFSSMLTSRPGPDSRYAVVTVALKNGEKIVGIKKEEDAESVRVYDIADLPAVLRTIQKTDIAKTWAVADWPIHKDNASLYTIKQLLDLVTFLKSPQSKSPVALADIL